MTWLITGGCGFVGANLAARLLLDGTKVVLFDNLSRVGSQENLLWLDRFESAAENLSFHKEDISNPKAIEAIVSSVSSDLECVAHLAGQVAMTTSIDKPRLDFDTNALGTFNLMEAVRKHAPEATIIYSSTNKVYGDLEHIPTVEEETRYVLPDYPNGLPESLPLDFSSPYGCSKGAADQYVRDWHRTYGLNTVVFRHSSMYGGRQYATYDQGWVGWFCSQAIKQKATLERGQKPAPFTISGDGKQVRDLLFAEDLVELYLAAHQNIDRARGQVFNIGGGTENSLSILEFLSTLQDLLSVELRFTSIPWRMHDQKVFIADIRKAKRETFWSPRISAREGIRRMLVWQQEITSNIRTA